MENHAGTKLLTEKNSDKECSPLDFTGRGLNRRIKKQFHHTKPIRLRSVIYRACSRYHSALFQKSNKSPMGHISVLSKLMFDQNRAVMHDYIFQENSPIHNYMYTEL